METIVQSDIFFFISSIGFIVISLISLVVGIFIVKTLKDFRRLISKIENEADNIIEDVGDLRDEVKSKIQTVSNFASVITSTAFLHKFLKGKKKKD